ncbi:uncharacterized protein LOC117334564 isoform X2 [Pecten maximus]|nr:uncharacterized protein LOC117334564 isoform X2 [Pecten maximus]
MEEPGGMQVDSHDWTKGHHTLGERNSIPRGCSGKPADIFMIFDTSGEITPRQLAKQKKYAIDLLRVFNLGDKDTRISVVTYIDDVMNISSFDDGSSIQNVSSTIMNDIPQDPAGPCKIDKMLKFIATDGFSDSNVRREVAHIAMLFVGNTITNKKQAKRQANEARGKGIYLYTLGQPSSNRKQLSLVSSRPARTFVFTDGDDNIVQSLTHLLTIHLCEFQIEQPANLRRLTQCHVNRPVDLIFSVDEINIGGRNAQKIFHLIEFLMSNINNPSNGLRVGLVNSKINYKNVGRGLSSVEEFNNKISSVAVSDHGDVIKRARRMLRRGRLHVQKTIIHFVDSNVDITKHALFEARKNKKVKLETFVIATGQGLDQSTLEKIASQHSSQHVFRVHDYHMMASEGPKILSTICASW